MGPVKKGFMPGRGLIPDPRKVHRALGLHEALIQA